MLVSIIVELKDKPGQLIKAIEPISMAGGNIIGVVHKREKATPSGKIPVEISVQIDVEKINEVIEKIRERGIVVRSYNEVKLLATTSVMLIGHIIHTDLSDTINRIDSTGFAEVVEMNISMPELKGHSTAMLTISAKGKDELKRALEILKDVCKSKGIIVIEPLDEDVV